MALYTTMQRPQTEREAVKMVWENLEEMRLEKQEGCLEQQYECDRSPQPRLFTTLDSYSRVYNIMQNVLIY